MATSAKHFSLLLRPGERDGVELFENLPSDAWMRRGIASGNEFTVHALAYITAGHVAHHARILRERYL